LEVSIGLTSAPGISDCGDDPVPCLADPNISKGVFTLGLGLHSFTIIPTDVPSGSGTGYLQATAIPEPSTWLILGSGLIVLVLTRRGRLHAFTRRKLLLVAAAVPVAIIIVLNATTVSAQPGALRFVGPTSSQPLALTADDAFLASVNTDVNTVSFFDVRADRNRKLAEVPVQTEPNGVVMLPAGSKCYTANTVSGPYR